MGIRIEVSLDSVTFVPSAGEGPGVFTVFASDLDLRPGEWPQEIALVDFKGDYATFFKTAPQCVNGDLVSYSYYAGVQKLIVYND